MLRWRLSRQKKVKSPRERGWGKGVWWGPGVGAMEANTWCTRSHDGHWGWVGAVGVAQAWQWGEGERRGQWAPARSFRKWWGGGGQRLWLQRMEGIS